MANPKDILDQAVKEILSECRRSGDARLYICRRLLRPAPFIHNQTPRIPDRELVTAIRVSEDVISHVLSDPDKTTRWKALQERLCQLLRFQNLARPPLTASGYRTAKRVITTLVESWGDDLAAELQELEYHQQCNAWDPEKMLGRSWKTLLAQNPKKPHQGRRFTEHRERIVACYTLLKQCGERDPGKTIAQILSEHGVKKIEAAAVDKIVQRYEVTPKFDTGGIYPPSAQLLTSWLEIVARVIPPPKDFWSANART